MHHADLRGAPNDVGRNVAQLGDRLSQAKITLILGHAGSARSFRKVPLLPVAGVLLGQLSEDPRSEVCSVVAKSSDQPTVAVRRLARDSSAVVRWWTLVQHPDDEVIARQLFHDSDPTNAAQAAANLEALTRS